MKTINRMVLLLATLFAAIGCSDDDKELVMYSLRFEPNSITLGIGKSYRLVPISDPFYDDVQYEWKSVDERVATVDQSGVVTGVSAGSTEVRAFYGDNRLARCLVSVVESTSSLPDPTAADDLFEQSATLQGNDHAVLRLLRRERLHLLYAERRRHEDRQQVDGGAGTSETQRSPVG